MSFIKNIFGKKILIIGDVNTGKTFLTSKIVKELLNLGYRREITIIDMAPKKRGMIGGTLADYINIPKEVRYLRPPIIYAPRTTARSKRELIHMIKENARNIENLLNIYLNSPSNILVVNDLTLYLHAGSFNKIIKCIKVSKTFIGNAYYGKKIKEPFKIGISLREKTLIERLVNFMDIVIDLNRINHRKLLTYI